MCTIQGSYCCNCEECCLLGCDAICSISWNLLPVIRTGESTVMLEVAGFFGMSVSTFIPDYMASQPGISNLRA